MEISLFLKTNFDLTEKVLKDSGLSISHSKTLPEKTHFADFSFLKLLIRNRELPAK